MPQKVWSSLDAPISPPSSRSRQEPSPQTKKRLSCAQQGSNQDEKRSNTRLAAIEAGKILVEDHLSVFSAQLKRSTKCRPGPFLSIEGFVDLYQRNQHKHGRHFVVHQHDHPVAGVHYDLRLQISETSSISFAIMYGLPGNPNSKRLNRNATETRVHNLWVMLIVFSPLDGYNLKLIFIEPFNRDCFAIYGKSAHMGYRRIQHLTLSSI